MPIPSGDVNILMAAYDSESIQHAAARSWLDEQLDGDEPFTIFNIVISAFLRIATRSLGLMAAEAKQNHLDFVRAIVDSPNFVPLDEGSGHLERFLQFFQLPGVQGTAVPDAYLAALAIEHDCEWVTFDRGFARFPGLRLRLLA